jgi:hypothetical protein
MSDPRLVYLPREDATLEEQLAALASIYNFVLECAERKKSTREEGNEAKDDGRDRA